MLGQEVIYAGKKREKNRENQWLKYLPNSIKFLILKLKYFFIYYEIFTPVALCNAMLVQ